ncbi:MAG: hypothetical protein ACOVLK_07850, partial [Terrimicrobiaceae bacterium]
MIFSALAARSARCLMLDMVLILPPSPRPLQKPNLKHLRPRTASLRKIPCCGLVIRPAKHKIPHPQRDYFQ